MKHIGNHTLDPINVDIIDSDTGESYGDATIEPGGRLDMKNVTAEQSMYSKLPTKDFNKNESFTKMYCKTFFLLRDKLTYAEMNFFIGLCQYVGYEDCILRTTGNARGKMIDGRQELANILGVSQVLCYKQLSALEKKEVVKIKKDGQHKYFMLNPFIVFRGKNLDVDTFLNFADTQWAKYTIDENSGDRQEDVQLE